MTERAERRAVWPLIVVRTRRATVTSLDEIMQSEQYVRQSTAIRQLADQWDTALLFPVIVTRSNAKYSPGEDLHLLAAIAKARRDDQLLVMDDAFRLIDCRSPEQAERGFEGLLSLKPLIYSISHGRLLLEMPKKLVQSAIADRVRQALIRSQGIKSALEAMEDERPRPTASAVESAVAAKRKRADRRAARLVDEIDRVVAALPQDRRQNRKAIAAALNDAGVPTPSGRGRWQGITVKRVLDRVADIAEQRARQGA